MIHHLCLPKSKECKSFSKMFMFPTYLDQSDNNDLPTTDPVDQSENNDLPTIDPVDQSYFVLTVNGHPYAMYKDLESTQKEMREISRSICLVNDTVYHFSELRHWSDVSIDVIKRLRNTLITYDVLVCTLRIKKIPLKSTLTK